MPKIKDPPNIDFNDDAEQPAVSEDYDNNTEEETREDILDMLKSLSESGEISENVKSLSKMSIKQLKAVRDKYERRQAEETNKLLAEILISQYSQLLRSMDLIGSAEDLEAELSKDKLLRRELIRLLGIVTPHVPLIGLVSAGIISAKHTAKYKMSKDTVQQPYPEPSTSGEEAGVPSTE